MLLFQTPIAIFGLICNLASCVVLASKEMRNSFNLMLIALALFDCGYLFGAVLESFKNSFHLATWLHLAMFPQFLHPGMHFLFHMGTR